MFFVLSKILGYLLQPIVLVLFLFVLAGLLAMVGWRRSAWTAGGGAVIILAVIALSPLGLVMLAQLENRFPRPETLPDRIAGIVVLGGAVDTRVGRTRGVDELNEAADRMTEAMVLARRYPDARVLFTGGVAAILQEDIPETDMARDFFESLGLEPDRLILEDRARNTAENAVYSREIASPQPGETWLLVTSAFHMPRSVGCFRAAGFDVVPYPVDYRTPAGPTIWRPSTFVTRNIEKVQLSVREGLGLAAYWWTGRIPELFPGPQSSDDGSGARSL
ncbi:YdcF family protein [Antarcticirhabdus aurantiaca]|uniref:YdcF family protein n=1 Tax=Antarcticirhabdus aurantiaca TaxID=2606717 RepID=A0ACD4NVP2_9HYPH|nr:YdcF family protein [Antarcticirhabdus aurantiaca]WAJ30853.1 YdcF family protein [Jeongeuplla avenae]